ncbi:MAG: radical SAM protein [Planctomycetota bacterium]
MDREGAVEALYGRTSPCRICPRQCGARRAEGELGDCRIGWEPVVSSAFPHFGEEAPLVGRGGSGTIFLAGCNLLCVFCQNSEISHGQEGDPVSVEEVAETMLNLERRGCHNVNFVTPTHVSAPLAAAVLRARKRGLRVPIVYNCGGYESVETLRLLEGFVEIYMPDFKFAFPEEAEAYAHAPDYPEAARAAFKEMHRQVGDLVIRNGLAQGGLLVRHLVMPGGALSSRRILDFLADEISPRTYVNVMPQYRPSFQAFALEAINRRPTRREYSEVRDYALFRGLRLDARNL